jgi:hypothetical protein
MINWGDFQNNNQTVYLFFPTLIGQDAEPIAGAGSPAVELYKDNSDTPITTGQTLSLVNSNAGAYKLAIELGEAYGSGDYGVYWSAGTADGIPITDRLIGVLSIGRYAAAEDITEAALAEPTSVPAANATLADKVSWIFAYFRNRVTSTESARVLYADDGTTVLGTEVLDDDDTTFDKGEVS